MSGVGLRQYVRKTSECKKNFFVSVDMREIVSQVTLFLATVCD